MFKANCICSSGKHKMFIQCMLFTISILQCKYLINRNNYLKKTLQFVYILKMNALTGEMSSRALNWKRKHNEWTLYEFWSKIYFVSYFSSRVSQIVQTNLTLRSSCFVCKCSIEWIHFQRTIYTTVCFNYLTACKWIAYVFVMSCGTTVVSP